MWHAVGRGRFLDCLLAGRVFLLCSWHSNSLHHSEASTRARHTKARSEEARGVERCFLQHRCVARPCACASLDNRRWLCTGPCRATSLGYSAVVQTLLAPACVLMWCCWVVASASFPWIVSFAHDTCFMLWRISPAYEQSSSCKPTIACSEAS